MKIIEKKYYPWAVVALLWVVALLNYMDRQMLSTMQVSMKADIHELNQAEAFGALMAVFLWVYGLVSPFAGICHKFRPIILSPGPHGHKRGIVYSISFVAIGRLA